MTASTGKRRQLVITDAGENFNPFDTGDVDEPGLGLHPGGGGIEFRLGPTRFYATTSPSSVANGFERPSQEPIDDTFLIDSSDGPFEVGPKRFRRR